MSDPHRFDPEGVDGALLDWQLINWREESFGDGGGRKVPKQPGNPSRNAKSNDASTWGAADVAVTNALENATLGVGFPCAQPGHPFVFIDVDTPDGGDWVPDFAHLEGAVVERSPSGESYRVILRDCSEPDWWTNLSQPGEDQPEVKLFDGSGYVTLTGDVVDGHGPPLEPTDDGALETWLRFAWRNFPTTEADDTPPWKKRDQQPRGRPSDRGGRSTADEWLGEAEAREALEHVEPDLPYDEWRDVGFALADHFPEATARRLFDDWSRGGGKYDDRAPGLIDDIVGRDGSGVTIATLVEKAKAGGWTPRRVATGETTRATADGGSAAASAPAGDVSTGGRDEEPIRSAFAAGCEAVALDPTQVGTVTRDGETVPVGVRDVIPETTMGEAVLAFQRHADVLSGTDKQAVIGRAVLADLRDRGEFFRTSDGRLYYFDDRETEVYRVDGEGRRTLAKDFQGAVWIRYNLYAGKFSRNLGEDLLARARAGAPVREVHQFAHYNPDAGELYVTDWGVGYYAVTPDAVEWRANGTDVYFLPDDRAEPYEYLEADERPTLPDELPGELPAWVGQGDPLMRVLGNRINFDDSAALSPLQQRKQLYLHLHTLPFIDELPARPIMAWVGEKGSGKTVVQRSVGRFVYGGGYTESAMPDAKDDFTVKVTNQALAFVDNYDQGEDWANDILAAIATGAGIDKRQLYTTNSLQRSVPRCWLSITSRNPPFRRDDVADRTLVFRVKRVDRGDFIGMKDYLRQVTAYRDLLWSTYLDNLRETIATYRETDTGAMSSSHRMADWAIFATIVADALEVPNVDRLLETMETERATFALENEAWAGVIGHWVRTEAEAAATWRNASGMLSKLKKVAEDDNRPFDLTTPQGVGQKFATYHEELADLYGLEIDDTGRSNRYRFVPDDDTEPTALGRF